jgi:hypothetical protein
MGASGSEIVLAAKKAQTWGTPVQVGANNGILILPASAMKRDQPFFIDDSLGLGFPTDGDLGEVTVDGELVGYMRYDSLDLLIGMAMGAHAVTHTVPTAGAGGAAASGTTTTLVKTAAGWGVDAYALAAGRFYVTVTAGTNAGITRRIISNTATQLTFGAMPVACDATTVFTISGAASTHVYTLAPNTDGQFFTLVAKLGTIYVDEITTAKCAGFTIKGGTGQPIQVAFRIIGHERNSNTVAGTNNNTTILAVTFPETANRLLYRDIKFRMNTSSGGAISDADRIYPVSYDFAYDRDILGVYGTGSSYNNIDEPTNNGDPKYGLKFELGRLTAAGQALIAAKDAGTAQKIDITFTGALLAGATYRSMLIEIPNAKFSSASAPIKKGILTVPAEMSLFARSAAPTGMAGLTSPFRLTLVNAFGGDVLQEAVA